VGEGVPRRSALCGGGLDRFRETEVEHFHRAIRPEFDVGRLEIAVHDPLLVCGFEGLGDLPRYGQDLGDGHRPPRDVCGEIVAIDELHDQRAHARLSRARRGRVLDAEDLRDIRMIERRERLGFTLEPGQPIGVVSERLWQDLDRDVAIELRVPRAEDLTHSACADVRGDFVASETGAASEGHLVNDYRCDERHFGTVDAILHDTAGRKWLIWPHVGAGF
jgi:hypothetical protein